MKLENGEIPAQGVTLRGKEMQQPTTAAGSRPTKLKLKHSEKLRGKSESLMIGCMFPLRVCYYPENIALSMILLSPFLLQFLFVSFFLLFYLVLPRFSLIFQSFVRLLCNRFLTFTILTDCEEDLLNQITEDTGTESAMKSEMELEHGEIPAQRVTLRGKVMQQPTTAAGSQPTKPKLKHSQKLRGKSESLMIGRIFPLRACSFGR